VKRLALLLLANGCILHTHGGTDLPGPADVREGAVTKRGDTQSGRDPGEHAYLVEASLTGGGAIDLSDTQRGGAAFGVEVSGARLALPEQHRGSVVMDKLALWRVRPVLGWTALRIEKERARVGPVYAEIQYQLPIADFMPWLTVGAGVAVDPLGPHPGPQGTACFGLHPVLGQLCLRGDYFVGRGGELGVFWIARSYLEHMVRR
jgi:hypothetical protein